MKKTIEIRPGQLITADQAKPSQFQHEAACSDCPFSRKALPGWLGAMTKEEWMAAAHGEATSDCHTIAGPQCAGMAIYRANVCKSPHNPRAIHLPSDHKTVFSSSTQFLEHHAMPGLLSKTKGKKRENANNKRRRT